VVVTTMDTGTGSPGWMDEDEVGDDDGMAKTFNELRMECSARRTGVTA
jgi:hypothetical protein